MHVLLKHEKIPLKSRTLKQNCRNFQCCPNQPGLLRQLKIHMIFSMFPKLEAAAVLLKIYVNSKHFLLAFIITFSGSSLKIWPKDMKEGSRIYR
jgi:hypothetical protein